MANSELIEIKKQLEIQENILQSTRNVHYVFQAIFLGICVAIFVLNTSIATSDVFNTTNLIQTIPVYIFLNIFIFIIFIRAYSVLNEFSRKLFTRGIVVDFLQHLILVNNSGKLESLKKILFKRNSKNIGVDFFVTIKYIERLSGQVFKRKLYKAHKNCLSDFPHLKFEHQPIGYCEQDFFVFICFINNIYDLTYLDNPYFSLSEARLKNKMRTITETRTGHSKIFFGIWLTLIAYSLILPILVNQKSLNLLKTSFNF